MFVFVVCCMFVCIFKGMPKAVNLHTKTQTDVLFLTHTHTHKLCVSEMNNATVCLVGCTTVPGVS